jgi:hypothetical protein
MNDHLDFGSGWTSARNPGHKALNPRGLGTESPSSRDALFFMHFYPCETNENGAVHWPDSW